MKGRIQGDLNKQHEFTTITTHNGATTTSHVVIGEINAVAQRLNRDRRELLKG